MNRKFIWIGPLIYTIEDVPNLLGTGKDGNLVQFFGLVDFGDQVIKLEENVSPERQYITLWHEIVHVILEQAGQDIPESAVEALGYGIAQVIKENPWMGIYAAKTQDSP